MAAAMAAVLVAGCSLSHEGAAVGTALTTSGSDTAPVTPAAGGSVPPASGDLGRSVVDRGGRTTADDDVPPVRDLPTTDAPAADDAPAEPATTSSLVLSPSAPVRLRIAAIGVDTDLLELGLEVDGSMEVPPGAFPAGWYTGAPTPGELGPAIIAGHVDWGGQAGVFAGLGALDAGDEVVVTRQDGGTAVFGVTKVQRVAKRDFPTAAVYGDLDHAGLRLVTCGGVFDRAAGSYEDNIIVFAELRATTRA